MQYRFSNWYKRRCLGAYSVEIYKEDGNGGYWDKLEDCPYDENGNRKFCINGLCAGEKAPEETMIVPLGDYALGGGGYTQYGVVPKEEGGMTATQYHQAAVGRGDQAGFTWAGDPTTLLAHQAATLEQEAYALEIYNRLRSGQSLTPEQWDYLTNNLVQYFSGVQLSQFGSGAMDYYYNWANLNYRPAPSATRYSAGVNPQDYIPQEGYAGVDEIESLRSLVKSSWSKYVISKDKDSREIALQYIKEFVLPENERESLRIIEEGIREASFEELVETKKTILGKYRLPRISTMNFALSSADYKVKDVMFTGTNEEARFAIEKITEALSEIGVSISPPTNYEKRTYFTKGGYVEQLKLIQVDWNIVNPRYSLMPIYHEAIHAFQREQYPGMPIAQMEMEAYIAVWGTIVEYGPEGYLTTSPENLLISKENYLIKPIENSVVRYYMEHFGLY